MPKNLALDTATGALYVTITSQVVVPATIITMKLNRKYRNPYILTHKNALGLFDRIFILGEKLSGKI
jgi:hypothetical protein